MFYTKKEQERMEGSNVGREERNVAQASRKGRRVIQNSSTWFTIHGTHIFLLISNKLAIKQALKKAAHLQGDFQKLCGRPARGLPEAW